MTNGATGEPRGHPERPDAPTGEAAALVARLLSGCDPSVAVGEKALCLKAETRVAPDNFDSIPIAFRSADLTGDHHECAVPGPPRARRLPLYSTPVAGLLLAAVAVLIFGSGLAVGYGMLGRHSKAADGSNAEAGRLPAAGDTAPTTTVDHEASALNRVEGPSPDFTVNSTVPALTGRQADNGGDSEIQRPEAQAQTGESEQTRALTEPLRETTADADKSSALLGPPADQIQPPGAWAAQLAPTPPSRPPASDGARQTVVTSAQPVPPEQAPTDSVHPDKAALPATKAPDVRGTTAFPAPPDTPPEGRGGSTVEAPGQIAPCRLVHFVQPIYPQEAKKLHMEGSVELRLVVAVDGTVRNISLVRGLPLLAAAAMNAARQFRYTPALLNGHPIGSVETVKMSFKLKK